MMKIVIISVLLGVAYSTEVGKCFTTSGDKVASAACTKKETTCSGPSYSFAAGVGTSAYGCGACVEGTDKAPASCVTCATADCNKVLEAGTDFECSAFEFKDGNFTAAAAKTKCKGLKGVDNLCNKPGTAAKVAVDYTIANAGCGPCGTAAQKTDKKCEEVAGAAGLTALLLPLLAALYTLF